jgi:uncharacterized protein (DUF3084 family)
MADPLTLAVAGLGIVGSAMAWAKARGEAAKARGEAAKAVALRELENERQESRSQEHTLARLKSLEGRMEQQADLVATLYAEKAELQRNVNDLAAENVRLAYRVVQLEGERDAADKRANASSEELATAKRMGLSHRTDRPPR